MSRAFTSALCVFSMFSLTSASHFRGGVVQWRTLADIVPGSDVSVEFTYRIGWRSSYSGGTRCDQRTIDNALLTGIGGDLQCRVGCQNIGSLTSLNYFCTDFSATEDWTVGEKSFEFLVPPVPRFEASFASGDWISLAQGGGNWEVRVKMNLNHTLAVGRSQNASPQTKMSPVIRLQHGCNHTIAIPVEDSDGDDVRCRWAESSMGECAGVCKSFPAELDERECILRYTANGRRNYYAVAVQIEDFATPLDTVALSSVPLQFLVFVYDSDESCYSKPDFDLFTEEDGACIGVPPNNTFNHQITAIAGGPGIDIVDITTQSPPGMIKSSLEKADAASGWYVNMTWTPTSSQLGPNIFCFVATDNTGRSSSQRCMTILGGVYPPEVLPDSLSPTGKIYPDNGVWSLTFDRPIYRPQRTAYIRFYKTETGEESYKIDASTSPDVTFSDPDVRYDVIIRTGNIHLEEKKDYFIRLDDGIVAGREFCGPENRRAWSSSFWSLTIRDVTPPRITFTRAEDVTSGNVNVTWEYDEEASSVCVLQSPSATVPVTCFNHTLNNHGLEEGYYTLYIQASDEEGNSKQYQHQWYVDLSAPLTQIISKPANYSSLDDFTFIFYCRDHSGCTYMCKFDSESFRFCQERHRVRNLQEGNHNISVYATDEVGNIGNVITHRWYVDRQAPSLTGISNVTVTCGDVITPTSLGYPTVTDQLDPKPNVTFVDVTTTQCRTLRQWTAEDKAGNRGKLTQVISFSNPSPARVSGDVQLYIACGSTDTIYDNEYILDHGLLEISHPCERDLDITYQDSASVEGCGVEITRTWTVRDDCGGVTDFTQEITVLKQSDPEEPEDGQINVPLYQSLRWPQYPEAARYNVYVWEFRGEEPEDPVRTTSARAYHPSQPFPPNTQLLWKVGYLVPVNGTTREIPSPVWGMTTRAFADLSLVAIMSPTNAFSGNDVTIQWRVENVGNQSTSVSSRYWIDAVYMGPSGEFQDARIVKQVRQNRFVDPNDGFLSEIQINLKDSDIGNFYIFIKVDYRGYVEDYSEKNNFKQTTSPIKVQLTPPPNLIIGRIFTLGTAFSGQKTTISWTVKNAGLGITQVSTWSDAVYISADGSFDDADSLLATVSHTGELISNSEYDTSAAVTLPNAIYGTYVIFVIADVTNVVYEHTDEEDNRDSLELEVILSPTPDFIIKDFFVSGAGAATTGDAINVQYSVRNQGGGRPFERWWTDKLTMTSSSNGRIYHTDETYLRHAMLPGETYNNQFSYRVPQYVPSGSYNFSIHVDDQNYVFEFKADNNNIRSQTVNIQQALPDLQVAEGTISLNQAPDATYLVYNMSIMNSGSGYLFGASWVDTLYLAAGELTSAVAIPATDQKRHSVEMAPGEGYSFSGSDILIPQALTGDFFIYVATDNEDAVEEEMEANNFKLVGKVSIPKRLSDLVIGGATVESDVLTAGDTAAVTWEVINEGNLAVTLPWYDSIYLSRDEGNDESAVLLARVEQTGVLGAGEALSQDMNITIPLESAGFYNLVVRTGEYIGESIEANTKNNNFALGIQVFTPPSPNFNVDSVKYEFLEERGKTSRILSVTVDVQNHGNSILTSRTWADRVMLQERTSSSAADTVAETRTSVTLSLLSQESYTITHLLVIPIRVQGFYDLVVDIDYLNDVLELFGEHDNKWTGMEPIKVPAAPYPNLQATIGAYVLPNKVFTGDKVEILYTVDNKNGSDVAMTSWTDGVFLYYRSGASRREILHSATRIGTLIINKDVKVGGSLSLAIITSIPYGLDGEYKVYILPDIRDRLSIPGGSVAYNIPSTIRIEAGALPDLTVSVDLSGSDTMQSGQAYTVSVHVENQGNSSAAGTWYDTVYLSEDPFVDPFDFKLKTTLRKSDLPKGQSYQQPVEIFIPYDLAGSSYYILAETNIDSTVIESMHENNFDHVVVRVVGAPAVDILTKDVTHSISSASYLNDVTFRWAIENNGSETFSGYKCDTVYLSPDDKWDIGDVTVSGPTCARFELDKKSARGSSKSYSAASKVPQVVEGKYKTIVRTRNNARDINLENNIGTSVASMDISPPVLNMGVKKSVNVNENSNIVIKINEIPIGIALLVSLDTNNQNAYHQMYLKASKPPQPYAYEAISKDRQTRTQRVYVPYTRSSVYYLLVESISPASSSYSVNLLAIEAKFTLNSIYPPRVASRGTSTIRLNGMLFGNNLGACLYHSADNSKQICATHIERINSELAYATFDMRGSGTGTYKVELTDVDKTEKTTLKDALEVIHDIDGKLELEMVTPAPLRSGETAVITCHVHNVGYSDLKTPLLVASSGGNSRLYQIGSDPQMEPQRSVMFLPMVADEPGRVIPPRTTRTFVFRAFPLLGFVGEERLVVVQAPAQQFRRFVEVAKKEARPSHLPASVWRLVYDNFLSCLDKHEDGIAGAVRQRAAVLNKYSSVTNSIPDIITNLLVLADGRLANARLFRFVDVVDRESAAGSPLMLERVYPGSLSLRRTMGLFGYGWTSPWLELKLVFVDEDNILLRYERREYEFIQTEVGIYRSRGLANSYIQLQDYDYQLYVENVVFMFKGVTGILFEIINTQVEETVTVTYDDSLPVKLHHSSGTTLMLEHGMHGVTRAKLLDGNQLLVTEGRYSYNTDGYLSEFVSGSKYTTYTYNSNGDLNTVIYPTGDIQKMEYDDHFFLSGLYLLSSTGETLSNQTFQQRCDGSVTVTENPIGVSSTFYFGIGGGLLSHEPTVGEAVTYRSDPHTSSVTVHIGDEETINESYDPETKITTRMLANGDELNIQLNEDDYIHLISDSVSTIAELSYDNELVEKITYADGSLRRFYYNADDRVKELTLEDESKIQFEYDPDGSMIREITERDDLEFTYNSKRQLTEISNSDGTTKIEYNSDGSPEGITYPNGDAIRYQYNHFQQRTQVSSNSDYEVNYFYDNHRRLSYMTNKQSDEIVRLSYDQYGRLSRKTLGNGMYDTYTYQDNTLRLSVLKHYDSSGSQLNTYSYAYNDKGYRTSMTTDDVTYKYRYDASGQLIHWESTRGASKDLLYDSRQNRLTAKTSTGTTAYKTNILSQYTERGQFESFTYDKLGNLVERSEKRGRNTVTEKYSFDQNKRMTRTEAGGIRCEYKYNVFGAMSNRMCTDGSEEQYLVDPFSIYGSSVLIQTENGIDKMIYHALEQGLVGTESSAQSFEYFLFNGDGSTSLRTNNQGEIVSTYEYDPFGNPLPGSSSDDNMYRFLGKYGTRSLPHVNPGLCVMGARVYDPRIGRFMSMDPLGAVGSPTNPYTYANNNPLSYHDPHGLIFLPLVAAGAVIGAITGAAANAIGQGINIYANGGSASDFSFGDLGGAALAGGITGAAITTGAALPAVLGGGALATGTGLVVTGAGGYLGGFVGSATSDALNGRPFDVNGAMQSALINAAGAYIPFSMLRYGGKGASAFGSPFIGQMRPLTPYNPFKPTGQSIWSTLGLGNAVGILPGLWPESWPFPPSFSPPGGPWGGPYGQCPIPWIQSRDPNDILGPPGYGDSNFIQSGLLMEYKIRFENDENATAPAQRVIITSPLDLDLDITTFRLGGFGFGDLVVELDYNSPFHQQMVNDTDQSGTFVFFQAGYDVTKNEATWLFQTVDPDTGLPPSDPRIGFLPPNNGTSGEGYITFSIRHKEDISHMAQVDATASIVFDENGPIETPPIFHTIDTITPNASVDSTLGLSSNGGLLVNVIQSDSGAGVKSVDIYSVDTSGELTPLVLASNETSVLLPITAGKSHVLAVSAVDHVGNVQPLPAAGYKTISFTLDCPGNCSQHGLCGGDGLCVCDQEYFGQDCSVEGADFEPPILDFSADDATEATAINAHLSARLPISGSQAALSIAVSQLMPPSTIVNKGKKTGGMYTLSPDDFGEVKITPPAHFSGHVNFTVVARAELEGRTLTREQFISLPVLAVADAPFVDVQTDCFKNDSELRIVVDVQLVDQDGSEVLTVKLGGKSLNQGVNYIPVPSNVDKYTFIVTAEAKELSNNDVYVLSYDVTAEKCDVINPTPKPTTADASIKKQCFFATLIPLLILCTYMY